jgi:oxygen-independent coproporphyrinogen-3 oxidase
MAGIYLHIPYCKRACHYCNFHFSTTRYQLDEMMNAIAKEASLQRDYLAGQTINTLYFGGGTPSLLDTAHLQLLLDVLQQHYVISSNAEITLEANPDDITPAKAAAWQSLGINRLSIGIQSFADADLQWMNRAHNAAQAIGAIRIAQDAGLHNLTIDLIYGTPTLSNAQWEKNVQTALALNIPHLSCYALTVEPQTALHKMIERHKLPDTDPEQQAAQFLLLMQWLADAGYEHYEISNFAKPGHRSLHNTNYWQGVHYLGIGPSAHSFNGSSRQWNIANNALYLQALANNTVPVEKEILTPEQQLNEYIMTALRTMEGIDLTKVKTVWGEAAATRLLRESHAHQQARHLIHHEQQLILTRAGKLLADGIAAGLFQLSIKN